jgi:glutamyl-tRNA synthetase
MVTRTRIAPSPTGDPHLGTAYIALFNLCFAQKSKGEFILRIEDTDQVRSNNRSEKMILESLKWLGLTWSEGPDIGGKYGPYRQSERLDIYRKYAKELVDKGHAFYCFATPKELSVMRNEQISRGELTRYDGRGLNLSRDDIKTKIESGDPYVIRMKIPEEGECEFQDILRGKIHISWSQVDMQILLKADGTPTYHLANVVDDHLMKITHVIRGEEWINSTPKHVLLYRYFNWDMPEFCHLPLLRNTNKSKLSKRKNPTSINFYKDIGYLPEALLNYLGRMGWSMPNQEEKFTLSEMFENFDISEIHLGGPIFDIEKLNWLNGCWIRENLNDSEFADRAKRWALNSENINKMMPLIKDRVEKFSDIVPMLNFMFSGIQEPHEEKFQHKKLDNQSIRQILQYSSWCLDGIIEWNRDNLYQELNKIAVSLDLKLKDFLFPLFIAVTGAASGPPLFDSMALLGPDIVRARIRGALQAAGGVSKKQSKVWEKDFRN